MIIKYYFDVTHGRSLTPVFVKKNITINTGEKKPDQQHLFNAIDQILYDLYLTYGEGRPVSVIHTKTEYITQTKK